MATSVLKKVANYNFILISNFLINPTVCCKLFELCLVYFQKIIENSGNQLVIYSKAISSIDNN